jgi:hypothetical protein
LSEDSKLDDLNTNFCGGYDESDETPFILSFDFLSQSKVTTKRIIIDERFLREKNFAAINEFSPKISSGIRERKQTVTYKYDNCAGVAATGRECFAAVAYGGADRWHDHRHFSVPWNRQSFYTRMV